MLKVSIITPVYNGARYIRDTISSVLAQTFTDYEMIIIDDGSTDHTAEMVRECVKQAPDKIRYLHQTNGGPANARNHGIRESKGEYIAFLDADDLWLPDRLKKSVALLDDHPEIGLTHARSIRIDKDGNRLASPPRHAGKLSGNIFTDLLLRKAHISCLTVTLRKKCLDLTGAFDESPQCVAVEDRDLWLRIAKKFKVRFIDEELGYYRVLEASISRDPEKMIARKKYVIEKNCREGAGFLLRQRAMSKVYRETADELLGKTNRMKARQYYADSLKQFPLQIWGWVNLIKSFKS